MRRHPIKSLRMYKPCLWCIYSDADGIYKARAVFRIPADKLKDNYIKVETQ